jgi:dTDP-4-dehydrorhamnose reductase
MSTILVFGAEGQLGRELAERTPRRGIATCMIGRAIDIADSAAVAQAISSASPDLVVNAAAYTKVDRAESEPDAAFRANAEGPAVLAEACAAAEVALLHVSTDYVFDGSKSAAYVEDDPVAPLSVYGRSKAEGEAAIQRRLEHHVILRTSWTYGIFGVNFLKTILRLARERDQLLIVADQRGCPTGTADLAEAILGITPLVTQRAPVWGTYHFAGQGVTTWHGFASEIVDAQAAITNRRPAVVPISTTEYPTAARRPANSELDCSRFAAKFGVIASDWRERTRDVTTTLLRQAAWGQA